MEVEHERAPPIQTFVGINNLKSSSSSDETVGDSMGSNDYSTKRKNVCSVTPSSTASKKSKKLRLTVTNLSHYKYSRLTKSVLKDRIEQWISTNTDVSYYPHPFLY